MHNLFRCSCGARVVCGVGDEGYDSSLSEIQRDHRLMGHDILKL